MKVVIYNELEPKKGIRYSREHIRRKERDGTFPMHINLGEARIGWIEQEIDDWITGLAARRTPVAAEPALLNDSTQLTSETIGLNATTTARQSDVLQPAPASLRNRPSDQDSRPDQFA
jgi:predicted DNA-binding transcriptional regulator AlpA